MKIGFFTKWYKNSLASKGNVVGDELWARSLIKYLKKTKNYEADIYTPNEPPEKKLDVMIYLNEYNPNKEWAIKNIFYFQNISNTIPEIACNDFLNKNYNFDAYISFSKNISEILKEKTNRPVLYLPFAADTEIFYPRDKKSEYMFEVAYVGNDIKGTEATMKYIYPAVNFKFGLFGNWQIPKYRFKFWKNFKKLPPYKKEFEKLSKGKIPQEELPYLYSSAKIILNCTAPDAKNWDIITLRTYEVLACGGFLISDETPLALKELSNCIIFTKGGDDLIQKISFYLENEDERKKIAQKGYEYAKSKGNVLDRVISLVDFLENKL